MHLQVLQLSLGFLSHCLGYEKVSFTIARLPQFVDPIAPNRVQ